VAHCLDERGRTIGASLEERSGRHAKADTAHLFVNEAGGSPAQRIAANDRDAIRDGDSLCPRRGDHEALTGGGATAQRHLLARAEVPFADQRVEQWMRDETRRDPHRVVRRATAEREVSIAHHAAHRGAIGHSRQRDDVDRGMVEQAGHALERVVDDAHLERPLPLERRVLPITASAASGHGRARRLDPPWRRLDHLSQFGGCVVAFGFDDLGDHHLVGQCSPHEDHPAVGVAGNCGASLGHAGRVQLRPIHHGILAMHGAGAR